MDERIEAVKLILIVAIAIAAGALAGCVMNTNSDTDRYWSRVAHQVKSLTK